jgi:hypothetical protein
MIAEEINVLLEKYFFQVSTLHSHTNSEKDNEEEEHYLKQPANRLNYLLQFHLNCGIAL